MTDEYEKAVKKLVDYIGASVDFAKEQAPDVAREILVYGAYTNYLVVAFATIFAIIGFIVFMIGLACDEGGKQTVGGMLGLGGILFIGFACSDLYKIEHAPKLYILDDLRTKISTTCNSK